MTKSEIIAQLNRAKAKAQTHDDAMLRAELVGTISKVTAALANWPDVGDAVYAGAYVKVREYVGDCYLRERQGTVRKTTAYRASVALNTLGVALGVADAREIEEPQQAAFEVVRPKIAEV